MRGGPPRPERRHLPKDDQTAASGSEEGQRAESRRERPREALNVEGSEAGREERGSGEAEPGGQAGLRRPVPRISSTLVMLTSVL